MSVYSPSDVLSRHDFTETYTNEFDSNQTDFSIITIYGDFYGVLSPFI